MTKGDLESWIARPHRGFVTNEHGHGRWVIVGIELHGGVYLHLRQERATVLAARAGWRSAAAFMLRMLRREIRDRRLRAVAAGIIRLEEKIDG